MIHITVRALETAGRRCDPNTQPYTIACSGESAEHLDIVMGGDITLLLNGSTTKFRVTCPACLVLWDQACEQRKEDKR